MSLEEKKKQLANQIDEILKQKEEQKSLANAGENKEKLTSKRLSVENHKKSLNSLNEDISAYDGLVSSLSEKQKVYIEITENTQKKSEEYNAKYKAFMDEQAGILAESLVDGQPCPVCGSPSHPCIAYKSENAPTEAQLKKSKEAYDKAQKAMQSASSDCAAAKASVESKKAVIRKQISELTGTESIEETREQMKKLIDNAQNNIEELEKAIAEEDKKVQRKKELDECIPKEEKFVEEMKTEVSNLDKTIASTKATSDGLKKQIEQIAKELKYESQRAVNKKLQELNENLALMKESLENAEKAYSACNDEVVALKAKIQQLNKQLENAVDIDANQERARKADIVNKKTEKTNLKQYITTRITTNTTALKNIQTEGDNLVKFEGRYAWIKSLSNTANGNITGKEKIMLEAYIQMTYFDQIIARANTHLMVMSGGQYELKRCKEAENNRTQCGLDLDVIDHYNGTERSVKTLSGGESFKASLSLALGLSDKIQSSAGGIRLDTMFIDEGFGSLDEESLDQAMKALSVLSEGNRLVGIISHVAELRDRIDKQIIVTKEKSGGSKITIVS